MKRKLRTYKVEAEDDDFFMVHEYSDKDAVRAAVAEVIARGENHIFGIDELDDDYNEIRSIIWQGMLAGEGAA